jgi:hypothetical protein
MFSLEVTGFDWLCYVAREENFLGLARLTRADSTWLCH